MKYFSFLLLCLSISFNAFANEIAFEITPKNGTSLPTAIIPGQSAVAYYTVSNVTPISSPITGNFVKYFPPNVSQQLTDATYSDICQTQFTLQPQGDPGDSCTLKLEISGPVHSVCSSTNPHDCLFVCMSDRTTCNGTKSQLKVSAATPIAVGYWIDSDGKYFPLSYSSTDGGLNWSLTTTPLNQAPAGHHQGILNAATCVSNHCSAVGYTLNDDDSIYLPLSYVSTNQGLTWKPTPQVTLPTDPPSFTSGLFNQISCESSDCVVVGNLYYSGYTSPAEPLAYHSNDYGKDWNLSEDLTAPVSLGRAKDLWGVSCEDHICTAVGQDNNLLSTAGTPLGYYSNDDGLSWNPSSAFTLPGGQAQGLLLSTDCQGSHCVAAGVAYNNSFLIIQFLDPQPLVYLSDDHGSSWSSPVSVPPAGGKSNGLLWGVTCNNDNCVAVGQAYDSASSDSIPTAYLSNDGGSTWSPSLTGLNLPSGSTQGLLYTVSCTNAYCIAVGEAYSTYGYGSIPIVYTSGSGGIPLVYTSSDYGANWTLSAPLPLPTDANTGTLIGVSAGS
jgi:hypothetical protein